MKLNQSQWKEQVEELLRFTFDTCTSDFRFREMYFDLM